MKAAYCRDGECGDSGEFVWSVSASVARRTMRAVLRNSQTGPVLITRGGRAQAVVLGIGLYKSLEQALQTVRAPK
ncbi:type II toxin-antitoxin system prevent-host-death family antitoxin [Lysobacter korlensis]|uniref:Type II toxin-antitoxin system prevent-host-death family antitoxin n=1 Tax=Lysobacter korlensis TaxID=553636 RepID=A0ABV6RR46_9GAMM